MLNWKLVTEVIEPEDTYKEFPEIFIVTSAKDPQGSYLSKIQVLEWMRKAVKLQVLSQKK